MMINCIKQQNKYLHHRLFLAAGIMLCMTWLFAYVPAAAQTMQAQPPVFPRDYPVIHPQFRKWASPALNNEVASVSPVLLWPAAKKATGYDIRLSQDAAFAGATITEENIPWTMYNTHRELAKGNWYWQYRVHGGKWSDVLQFRITARSEKSVSPPVEKLFSSIPAAHPRVLVEKKDQSLFAQRAKNSEDATAVLEAAAEWLQVSPPREEEGLPTLKGSNKDETDKIAQDASKRVSSKAYMVVDLFCKAYLLTGEQQYAKQAIAWATELAGWDPDGISYLSDFGDSRCMLAMALVFDTFHDQLTADQKTKLLTAVKARAGRFYHEWINVIDAKVLSNHVWQYILHYFFQSAIAVYGEIDEAKQWIRYAYELWMARAPVLGGDDGGWCEGASYFRLNMETLLGIPSIIKEYTGFDFINSNGWYAKNPYWILYSFPPASSSDGFGDDVEKVRSPGKDYLAYADALAKLTQSPVAAWYAAQIAKTEKIKLSDADMLRWFRMRYLQNVKSPAPVQPATLPKAMVFRGTGVADIHSDIADRKKDIMVSLRASPYGSYGHLLADQNTFNVLTGGDRLFYMSGHKVAMQDPHRLGWYKATQGHNGVLIDDKGQPFHVEAYGYIPRFINGKKISYIAGDASQAYRSEAEKQQTGLKKFRRHLLFLQPDILLVYDELEADHAAKWSWLIHSPYKMEMDKNNNRFYCNSVNATAETALFTSQPLQWSITDTYAVAAVNWVGKVDEEGNLVEYKNDQWHLTAATTIKTSQLRILAVMQISSSGEPVKQALPARFNDKNELLIGDWVIKAELDADKPALLEAYNNKQRIAFTSGAETLKTGTKTFTGKKAGSSKLAEMINGQYVFTEEGDVLPEAVKMIPVE